VRKRKFTIQLRKKGYYTGGEGRFRTGASEKTPGDGGGRTLRKELLSPLDLRGCFRDTGEFYAKLPPKVGGGKLRKGKGNYLL